MLTLEGNQIGVGSSFAVKIPEVFIFEIAHNRRKSVPIPGCRADRAVDQLLDGFFDAGLFIELPGAGEQYPFYQDIHRDHRESENIDRTFFLVGRPDEQ